MPYYTQEELKKMNFKYLGKNVMVSTLAQIYHPEKTELHDHVRIDDFCVLIGEITLKRYVHLALYCHIAGSSGKVVMDEFSECAYRCTIISHSSDYSLEYLHTPDIPYEYKQGRAGPVHIGKYSLLGYNTLVMPNVTIADGCSFGAFSYVNKDTLPWGLYDGKPVKRICNNKSDCKKYVQYLE